MIYIPRIKRLSDISSTVLLFVALFASLFVVAIARADSAEKTSEMQIKSDGGVLVVSAIAGTKVSVVDGEKARVLGVVGGDGVLMLSDGVPTGEQVFIFEHVDAQEAQKVAVSLAGGKPVMVKPALKMRPASLTVACQPADTEIFVDGVHKGRGVVMLGNLPAGKEISVEVRSSRYGSKVKRVTLKAGDSTRADFDLRGNTPIEKPDGKIVLPDVPLVLASQPNAVLKIDGVASALSDGAITELPIGERVLEIFLPLGDRLVLVWKGSFVARSAIMPGADTTAIALPAKEDVQEPTPVENPAPAKTVPEGEVVNGTVSMVAGTRFIISVGAKQGLADGGVYTFKFAKKETPISVRLSGVSGDSAIGAFVSADADSIPEEGDAFTVVLPKSSE